jgi:hypothetical protein
MPLCIFFPYMSLLNNRRIYTFKSRFLPNSGFRLNYTKIAGLVGRVLSELFLVCGFRGEKLNSSGVQCTTSSKLAMLYTL